MEKLNNVFQAASQQMYNSTNQEGGDPNAGQPQGEGAENAQDEVTDVDFEEVNEKKQSLVVKDYLVIS